MSRETLGLSKKIDDTEERAAIIQARLKNDLRERLIVSSIAGLAMTQLDNPGRQAMNAIRLADAVILELGWK
jgi:hypothetical protein